MDTLKKRKPRVFIPGLTPAASLGKPTHSSTPTNEFPRTRRTPPKATNRSFPPTTQPVNTQLARRLSQKGSISSTASNEVTIVERSLGIDLYTDETQVCGTSQFADEAVHDQLAFLAFTANDSALLSEEEVEFTGLSNVNEAGFTPPLQERPLPVEEPEEVEESMENDASTNPPESEAAEDLMTTREVLAKAAQSLSASQVLANQNQAEIRKRQEELDLELRRQATNSVSKAEFDDHTRKVLEYMAVVKSNAELKRDNINLEMQKLQKHFGANEAQQSNDMKRMSAELI